MWIYGCLFLFLDVFRIGCACVCMWMWPWVCLCMWTWALHFLSTVCLTVAQPHQTRQLARCLVETTPVCLQITSNNADSLCTCQSVSNYFKKLAASISAKCLLSHTHTHFLSCLSLSLINSLLNTVSFLPSVCWTALISALSKQTVTVYRMDSDTTSH